MHNLGSSYPCMSLLGCFAALKVGVRNYLLGTFARDSCVDAGLNNLHDVSPAVYLIPDYAIA